MYGSYSEWDFWATEALYKWSVKSDITRLVYNVSNFLKMSTHNARKQSSMSAVGRKLW